MQYFEKKTKQKKRSHQKQYIRHCLILPSIELALICKKDKEGNKTTQSEETISPIKTNLATAPKILAAN